MNLNPYQNLILRVLVTIIDLLLLLAKSTIATDYAFAIKEECKTAYTKTKTKRRIE